MPNGHNATPRIWHPLVFFGATVLAASFYADNRSAWLAAACVLLAAGFGWRLSFSIVMWDAMEYGGAYTPPEQMASARRRHATAASVLALCSVAAITGVLGWIHQSS